MHRNGQPNDAGFSLIEALVALAILAISVSGGIAVIANAMSRQAGLEQRHAAQVLAASVLEFDGVAPSGSRPSGGTGPEFRWQVTETDLAVERLADAPVRWVQLEVVVIWRWRGTTHRIELRRVDMRPIEASP